MSNEKAVPEIPRYEANIEVGSPKSSIQFVLDADGSWMHWSDVRRAVDALKAQLATAKQVAEDALTWEQEDRRVLKGRLERLEAPVTEEELAPYVECIQPAGEDACGWYVAADQVQNIILARVTPPQSAEKIGGGASDLSNDQRLRSYDGDVPPRPTQIKW